MLATGIADLAPGRPARLIDVVEDRSGAALTVWLTDRDSPRPQHICTMETRPMFDTGMLIDRTASRAEPLTETPIFYAVRNAQTPIFHALITGDTIDRPDTQSCDEPIRQIGNRRSDPTAPYRGDPTTTTPIPVPIHAGSETRSPAFSRPRPAPWLSSEGGRPQNVEPHPAAQQHPRGCAGTR